MNVRLRSHRSRNASKFSRRITSNTSTPVAEGGSFARAQQARFTILKSTCCRNSTRQTVSRHASRRSCCFAKLPHPDVRAAGVTFTIASEYSPENHNEPIAVIRVSNILGHARKWNIWEQRDELSRRDEPQAYRRVHLKHLTSGSKFACLLVNIENNDIAAFLIGHE